MRCRGLLLSLVFLLSGPPGRAAVPPPGVWVRVTLLSPEKIPWIVQIVSHSGGGRTSALFAGQNTAPNRADVQAVDAGASTPWIDLAGRVTGVSSVRFLFELDPRPRSATAPLVPGGPPLAPGVRARIDIGTSGSDDAVVRSITETDTGSVIALRIPANLVKDRQWLLSIREDTERRLEEVRKMKLPPGPLPKNCWFITGFRANGQFYTDPAITQMDFDIIRTLGMNGFWEQNGGQPGDLRRFAQERGMDRSTVYPRDVASPPRDAAAGGVRMDWGKLQEFVDQRYHGPFAAKPDSAYPPPKVIADLMDEPDGIPFAGPEYQQQFRAYLQGQKLTPEFFGENNWDEITAPICHWRDYFKLRAGLDPADLPGRRLFYHALRFWNAQTARLYAMATKKVEALDPNVIGTRVNFGPPWWYDYGTLPRGIDAFEFGRQRGVSLGFNEDWIGSGSRRLPLEVNAFLIDWSRAAMRPQKSLIGDYITRDADRTSVKLRTFGCLARGCKIFDFYYYGPAYTQFDPWSDNLSMVQGVGELSRQVGWADDILWDAQPPAARVALLYSKSWPVWKADDTEQNEMLMVYLALLHAGIPVDIVSDEDVAAGRLSEGGYRCLYVVNESIPAAAAKVIEDWVSRGGWLWAEGWAGMRDEYNSSTDAWNGLLGVTHRTWKPAGDLKRFGELTRPDDWTRPIFRREMEGDFAPPRQVGTGQVRVATRAAGFDYMDGAKEIEGALAHAVVYPAGPERNAIARMALDSGIDLPAVTDTSQVLAWPLWRQGDGVVLLANYTGEPVPRLHVRLAVPIKIKRLESLRHGRLKFTRPDPGHIEYTLPVEDVTDVIRVR